MDQDKLRVLRDIGYRIGPACGLCTHGTFATTSKGQADWGTCDITVYEHQKHVGPLRFLSIHRMGRCPSYQLRPTLRPGLHGYGEFA